MVKLANFINEWDNASLSQLGSESYMLDLMMDQSIYSSDGSSVLDYLSFRDGLEINISNTLETSVEQFKAPWE